MQQFSPPYLVFLADARDNLAAKMGVACAEWRREACVGQLRLPGCGADAGLPDRSIESAREAGARTFVLGTVASGGRLDPAWTAAIAAALAAGLDVVSGMHQRLDTIPELRAAALRSGARLFDIRHSDRTFATGTGAKRPGKRLLTVGTDCSCGKMFTTLHLQRELLRRGVAADFRATGQTGILIAGSGIAIDALVADFVAGAVEELAPAAAADHWDLIEGQGSLFHPAFAGVSLALLHGAQPDALVLCHDPGRAHVRGLPDFPLPGLGACIDANVAAARFTNPAARMVGISVNTSRLSPAEAARLLRSIAAETGLPAVDPLREGVAVLADGMLR